MLNINKDNLLKKDNLLIAGLVFAAFFLITVLLLTFLPTASTQQQDAPAPKKLIQEDLPAPDNDNEQTPFF